MTTGEPIPTSVPIDAHFQCGSWHFEVEKVQYSTDGTRPIVHLVAVGDPRAPRMDSGLVT